MKKILKKFGLTLFFFALSTGLYAYTVGQVITIGKNTYQVLTATAPDFTLSFLGTTASGELVIPATVDDGIDVVFTVTEVGGNEAYKSPNVTSVVLPETITKIKSASFGDATLTSFYVPKSVVEISHTMGYQWRSAPVFTVSPENQYFSSDSEGALYSKDGTELYMVPSSVLLDNGVYIVNQSVTNIKTCAFLRNSNLFEIVLPPNLQSVDEDNYPSITYGTSNFKRFSFNPAGDTPYSVQDGVLFKGNKLIIYPIAKDGANYKVPDGITEIAAYGFSNSRFLESIDLNEVERMAKSSINYLSRLATVTLPKKLSTEGIDGAIVGCSAISEYIVPEDCVNFMGQDGVVFSKDGATLYFYPPSKKGDTYDIPRSVTKIAQYAFRGQKYLSEMVIPSSVENIGTQAFGELLLLEKLSFEEPSQIKLLDGSPFAMCSKLKEVTLPSSLTYLSSAFRMCTALEVINVPDGSKLETIGNGVLTSNSALKNFNFLGSCDLKVIGNNAFANLKNLESIELPASVISIGLNAFSGCSNMTTATFADDAVIRSIGSGAFADCGLTSITIPNSVIEIGAEAFRNCGVLETVNLSANVTSIDPQAFKYCNNLAEINVDKDNKTYSSVDGYLLTADKETLVLFPSGKANSNFTLLPPSITTIGDYAFYACEKLTNVIIPNKVEKIGKRAFGLCTNLNTITFLSDEVIDPANIDQEPNSMSFDDGTNVASNMFENIDTYVRPHLQAAFQANEFYQKFRVVGSSFIDGGNEYLPVSDNTVDLLAVGAEDYTFVVPTQATGNVLVNNNGATEVKTYNVGLIGDYAFQNTSSEVHEVVVKNHVEYIGAKAFMTDIANNTSTIEKVFFIQSLPTARMLSTTRFELDETGKNYNEFAANTNIYVKKSALPTYQSVWTKQVYDRDLHLYKESPFNFVSQLDYKIPDVAIGKKYSTFAREFDTDFSDYFIENGSNEIGAFVAKKAVKHLGGDYGESEWHVKMTSVDMHGGYSGSYGYVPAYTGVLLKVLDQNQTASDFYYTIGEQDNQEYNVTDNIMVGVTENYQSVEASESDPIYVIQNGVFRRVSSAINKFPVHKAYMRLGEELPAGAKLKFVFDEETTAIGEVEMTNNSDSESAVYDLHGRMITGNKTGNSNLGKGIYIRNGQKFVVK